MGRRLVVTFGFARVLGFLVDGDPTPALGLVDLPGIM